MKEPESKIDEIAQKTAEVVNAIIEKAVEDAGAQSNMLHTVSVDRLRSFVERVERLREDQQAITADINEVMSEAKGEGYDAATIRDVVRLRAMDDYHMKMGLLQTYMQALGMQWPS